MPGRLEASFFPRIRDGAVVLPADPHGLFARLQFIELQISEPVNQCELLTLLGCDSKFHASFIKCAFNV